MNNINLNNVIPSFFNIQPQTSSVWGCVLSFSKGKRYLLRANSGHGKTSFCNFIYGLRDDYTGSITFDSTDIKNLNNSQWAKIRCNSLGIMPQDLMLFPDLDAIENIIIKNQIANHTPIDKIEEWISALGLKEHSNKKAGIMSYGQQQRIAFIRMLVQRADFLIMDEPVSHLDGDNAEVMSKIISEYQEETGCGIIITSVGNDFPLEYDSKLTL